MSLSKHQLKRFSDRLVEEEEPKAKKPRSAKRRCCWKDCQHRNDQFTMFTFPPATEGNIERLKEWVKNCESEEVALTPIALLNNRYFVCSDHFEISQFASQVSRKRLKSGAIPKLCSHVQESNQCTQEAVSENDVFIHNEDRLNVSTDADVNCKLQDGNSEASKQSSHLESFNQCTQDFFIHTEDRMNVGTDADIISTIQDRNSETSKPSSRLESLVHHQICVEHNYSKAQKGEKINKQAEAVESKTKNTVQCCFHGCDNTNRSHSMFKFPNVISSTKGQTQLNLFNLKRFTKWVMVCSNAQLLLTDPVSVHKKYRICDDHFDKEDIVNLSKSTLKKHSLPIRNLPSLLFKEEMCDEYNDNINKWKENMDSSLFMSEKACAFAFEEDMRQLKYISCSHCKEKILVSTDKQKVSCHHKSNCWQYSAINSMDPGDVPDELKDLTFIEEQLISRVHPMIWVYQIKKHQYVYKGHVICFPQSTQEIATQLELPHKVKDLKSVVYVRHSNKQTGKYHDFQVRSEKVRKALQWLKRNNVEYKDIIISDINLSDLPENGNVQDEIPTITVNDRQPTEKETKKDCDPSDETFDGINESGVTSMNFPHQDEQIKNKLKWPSISSEPVDEFHTPGYMARAFPSLFPYGIGDLHDGDRIQKIRTADYFLHLMKFHDDRFAKHRTFRYFAYNTWMRWTSLNDGNVFVANNPEFKNLTVSKLKDMLEGNYNVMKQIMFQASNLKGSKAYWNARANELRDMVEQLGLPTFFLTLSCADGHWNDLYKLLCDKDPSSLTEAERRDLIKDNPHVVDSFFDHRVQSFIKNVLEIKYKVKDFWYRIEYQHRGSPHLHGIFWVDGAPDVSNIENESEEYVSEVIDYFSQLVEAINPKVDACDPENHPCRTTFCNIKDFEEDLAQLLHKVQRHTKCSTDYCYKRNKKTQQLQCRFKFPIQMQEKATLEKDDNNNLEFKPARNDPRLNKFNAFMIQLWRANIDIAPVISKKALLSYLAKYISKCEVSSQGLHEMFNDVINTVDEDRKAKTIIQKVFMKSCVERDIGAQEVCHNLLRLKLHSAGGRKFVYVNMSDKKWLRLLQDNDEQDNDEENNNTDHSKTKGKTYIEKYSERPNRLETKSLWQCAKQYNVDRWTKSTKENIVRIFPRIKKKENESNEQYYRQQVLLHVPWRVQTSVKAENETWEDVYNKYNLNDSLTSMFRLGEEKIDTEDDFESDSECSSDEEQIDDAALLSRIGPKTQIPTFQLGTRSVDVNYNWHETYKKYENYGTISDFQNFIDTMKGKVQKDLMYDEDLPHAVFSDDQKSVIDIIEKQISKCKQSTDYEKRRIIVQGKAGTGKSFLIKYITLLLNKEFGPDSYLLAAPTGIAANLINGKTLHSVFKIPKSSKHFKPLKGDQARTLANTLQNTKFIIIDEYSMVGCKTLFMISERCKEATGINEDFGGLNVVLLGDIKQLPPVKDNAFFSTSAKTIAGQKGKELIRNFHGMFFLTTCHRQQDMDFLSVLDNLSEGKMTNENYKLLSSRFVHCVPYEEKETFDDALRIFATKVEVKEYNHAKMSELKDPLTGNYLPVANIKAQHNCSAGKKASVDNFEGLEKNLFLAKGCKIMLRQNLWVDKKLTNGTVGTVHDILYEPSKDFPSVILCEFPNYDGPEFISGTKIVPIKPVIKSWEDKDGKKCTRCQFPIVLAYACSIHKSQGMTLNKVVVNIGENEFALGIAYVALSRVKHLSDMLLNPFHKDRIRKIKTHSHLELRSEFIRYFHNKS